MLLSLSYMLLLGLFLSFLLKFFRLPSLIGYILAGMILGPFMLNQIDGSILAISAELRTIALVVILLRAGFLLDLKDLKENGLGAILLTFLPATFEIIGTVIFTYCFMSWTLLDGFILGTILAAVSPAIIVPRMIKLIEENVGYDHKVPQMVMAGASADDIYVILFFSLAITFTTTNTFNVIDIVLLPISIALGIAIGLLTGYILSQIFKKIHMRDTIKVLIVFGIALFVLSFENTFIPYSGLLAIISIALMILKEYPVLASRLLKKYEKIWVFAEMLLFILVGVALDLSTIKTVGLVAVALIIFALIIRGIGVWVSLLKTNLTLKEKTFVVFAYIPKATVQASIGSIPLSLGLIRGNDMLTIAVLSILITAPIGASLIDYFQYRLLKKDEPVTQI